jgi:DNA-binding response OmpR family regulator
MIEAEQPSTVVLDLGLPDGDGTELIQWIRRSGLDLPILVLTARDSLEDTVQGLDLGADDYMTKPFRLPEVTARLRALVRRCHAKSEPLLKAGRLTLDPAQRLAWVGEAALELSPKEWTVLEQLMLAAPKVVPKFRLLEQISSWDKDITPNSVEVHVSRIRQKLPGSGVVVRTLRGLGYRIEEESAPPGGPHA